jgi:predicted transcriptional regulator
MSKKPFTTRIDEEVLALAQRLADAERRSVTSLIEVAVLEYGARRGAPPPSPDAIQVQFVSAGDGTVTDGPKTKATRTKKIR